MVYLDLKAFTYLILLLNQLALANYNDIKQALSFNGGPITMLPTGANIYYVEYGPDPGRFRLYFHTSNFERSETLAWLDKHGIEYDDEGK